VGMRRVVQGRAGMVLAFMLGLVIATAGTATAARLITGKQLKDGSVSTRDPPKGVRTLLAKRSPSRPAFRDRNWARYSTGTDVVRGSCTRGSWTTSRHCLWWRAPR